MTDRVGLDRPLRILMLTDLYPPLITGEGHYVRNLSRALAERGSRDDLAAVAPLLADAAPPARVGAALATIRLTRRRPE